VFAGDDLHYQTANPKVTQAIRVVKGYCTMGRGAKKAEDGRQALEHTRAVRMAARTKCWRGGYKKCSDSIGCKCYSRGKREDIGIDAMGFRGLRGIRMRPREQRERKRFRISDRRRRKAKRKKKCPKRRGPRWDSNPRGYEQGIGPDHQRTGRHEPSSYTCDRGINFKNTGTGYGQYAHSKGISAQPTELRL
jgi:hypothetical protein